MRRGLAATIAVAAMALASCTNGTTTANPGSTDASATTEAPQVENHESGPETPIAYGVSIPRGAVQLGPLARTRSAALIEAYRPALEAAEAKQAAEEAEEAGEEPGSETTPTTEPTISNKPKADTFAALEEPPQPDITTSYMRVDGKPTDVVRRMLAQLSVLLPDAGIVTDDLAAYCKATDRRVTRCHLEETGTSPGGREITATLDVDPGNVKTRTGNAMSLRRPVMVLTLAYVGDPQEGQANRDSEDLADPPDTDGTAEKTGWIWPKMDEDALVSPLIAGWSSPPDTTPLLSGTRPRFAIVTTARSSVAENLSLDFVDAASGQGKITSDVVADLNEVLTSYTATRKDGSTIRAIQVVTARGSYCFLTVTPKAS